jgi:type IV secretory pathway VirJ component
MTPILKSALLALAAFGPSAGAATTAPAPASPALAHGLFSDLHVYRPAGAPHRFVMLVTEGSTPSARESAMLHAMLAADAMVATIPLPPFYARLAAQDGKCTYAPGAFENLSRYLQAFEQVPGYLPPVVAGADRTASYVQSVVAQAPAGIFAAGLAVDLQALALTPPPCAPQARAASGADASPATPWVAITDPQGAAFEHAFARLAVPQAELGAPPAQLDGLPIVEVPVSQPGKRFAVLLSGDGGWAGIDKSLGTALAAQGVPVAGFDSLRYFWGPRTPEELAADLDRVIRYYAAHWSRSEVLLVGYSQGADVLPFALNRLPAATRANVRLTALLGPGQKASFEFHLTNWIGPSGDRPIAPEALKLSAASTLCIYGVQEKDSLCPELAPAHARAMALTGGHHFGGDYAALATLILDAMPR